MYEDNQPIYHHFIPRSYLRRWADNERKVCRFSKPYDRIIPKMVSTRGTGGQDGLYALKSVAPEHAQRFEQGPMKAIDTAANHVLGLLEAGKRAQECVYGTNGDLLDFVREHMGTQPEKTLFERLVEFRKRLGG